MIYEKTFSTEALYSKYINSDDAVFPNVSVTLDDNITHILGSLSEFKLRAIDSEYLGMAIPSLYNTGLIASPAGITYKEYNDLYLCYEKSYLSSQTTWSWTYNDGSPISSFSIFPTFDTPTIPSSEDYLPDVDHPLYKAVIEGYAAARYNIYGSNVNVYGYNPTTESWVSMTSSLETMTQGAEVEMLLIGFQDSEDPTHITDSYDYMRTSYEYVDLGLSVKWAKTNLGAENEYDYGDYYMWGSTTPNTDDNCAWSTAPFNNGSSSYDSTYFASVSGTVCPDGILASEYDAAYVATDGKAHMPTQAQMQELIDGTDITWYASGNEEFNGIAGRKFANKSDSSKYIFIPASGYRYGSSFDYQGSSAYVWSSSLYTGNPDYAWRLYFSSNSIYVSHDDRYLGFTVRSVLE